MINKLNNRGFSLTEVLVATIVMSMIMGGVLGFVQFAGDIWHKGNSKIAAQNYSRMVFELLKQDLLNAKKVYYPKVDQTRNYVRYNLEGTKYKVYVASGTLCREDISGASSKSPLMRLARNVTSFYVTRLSSYTFEIKLQISEEQLEPQYDNEDNLIPPAIISSETMILLAPGVN